MEAMLFLGPWTLFFFFITLIDLDGFQFLLISSLEFTDFGDIPKHNHEEKIEEHQEDA